MMLSLVRRSQPRASPSLARAASSLMSDVHGTTHGKKHWKNKPLFRRGGDKRFRNGQEAADMLMDEVIRRDPNQAEYVQAVQNFVDSVVPVFDRYPKYAWVMKTLMEPERVIQFRVPWIDDEGSSRVNRGFRVQFSSSLGPYMGGLRFHPETTHGIAKFLGFETIFRNALAGPYGGAHGGSDFNPMDKSESEIMRFCQSFMTELANYIGPHTDVPTSGVGVGSQEIGYMFGQYKRLRQLHPGGSEGILSGGAYHHPQVTGYGVAHFANRILETRGETLKGKRCLISGSGTVALNVAQKLLDLGAIPIGLSDNFGYLIEEQGFTLKSLAELKRIKEERNARLGGYIMSSTTAIYHPSEDNHLWETPCDYAFPCAIQNDVDADAVRLLVKNGCKGIFEGANFPCTDEAISLIKQHGLAFGPNKASNGGSFALITKNLGASTQLSDDELDKIVKEYMYKLHDRVAATADEFNAAGDLHVGANITAFMSVAAAMFRQGVVKRRSRSWQVAALKCQKALLGSDAADVVAGLIPPCASVQRDVQLPPCAPDKQSRPALRTKRRRPQRFSTAAPTHAVGLAETRSTASVLCHQISQHRHADENSAKRLLLPAFMLARWSSTVNASTSTASGTLSCDRVALGAQSPTKWVVRCASEDTAAAPSAFFNPALVQNFYVSSGAVVAASSSDLNLSSTFSEVDELKSSSITKFSLSAAPGFTPTVPVTIAPAAFAGLSALEILYLEGLSLADTDLHLVLPASIQQISIVNCGLTNISFDFTDGVDSALSLIDLRHNVLDAFPPSLYSLPSTVSTIDLRDNDKLSLSTEITAHKKQLATWIDDAVLQADDVVIATLDASSQDERGSIVGSTSFGSAQTEAKSDSLLPTSSSGSDTSVKSTHDSGDMEEISITIVAVVVPAVLAIGVTLAFVVRKRRRMQDRDTDGVLDLPHPFGKSGRDRSETSGIFTIADSELSRSRMSSGEIDHHDAKDRDSCIAIAVTPTDAFGESGHQQESSTSANVGYVNLASPQDSQLNFSVANTRRQAPFREGGDSTHSLELLSTHSTASATPAQTRLAARKALRSALEALVTTPSGDGPATLTVNANRYVFGPGVKVEDTPLAFFIDCRVAVNSTEDASSEPAPPVTLVLKIFIEDDADLAGRESYALSCLQHDELSRVFAPRLYDTALEYELVLGKNKDDSEAMALNCCVLVLETPSCTTLCAHMVASRESLVQQISRVVSALRALHARGLVHGALHANSLVACSPDARLKFWGLEHASRAGHKVPCPDPDLLETWQAECVAPELAALALEEKHSSRASPSLDVWSLGVMILKMHVSGRQLEEFNGCTAPHDVFDRLVTSDLDSELSSTCYFERSIAKFVPSIDMKDLLRQCLQRNPTSRPSVDSISKHKMFQTKEREVSRPTTVRSAVVSRMLSAIIEEKDTRASSEPEREANGKDQLPDKMTEKELEVVTIDGEDTDPEPLPPSLWLFLPPVELEIDLTQRASLYSVDQWVSKLKRLQQQRGEELQFPLVFMCESCEANAAVPCSIAATNKSGATVTTSLLSLVMPLVRETMLFLEARAILSNGLSVGETSGLTGPQQWEELRTFYQALERMELATLNPVNEVELAPMEQQLKTRDPSKAQQVLDVLTALIFSKEKREYVRNLLDALVSDETLSSSRVERSSWAALRRCDLVLESSSTSGRTRWLCSHHAPQES
ncbi:NADP-specific glutamate dehydrogenase [Phytophthora fragariae]|uniref:NADP-specific glutamate dehydrogenase n=1 Tax=Phytophthora fragariae TaxID=53985 RepID=A0A6G0NJ45_9STRA|nr:NADP-specific glutamate dehydrogenase [Phytophthora fragariae]